MAEQNQDASLEAKEITEAALEQLIAHIKVALSSKADKNGNKVLSTNDFTDEEKSKLAELYNYDDTEITALLNNKVDKADGKELSSNDFTDAYKDKIDGIETDADVNTIESITVNGTEITPDANKNVAITVITNSVNNLLNYYLKSETYTKEEVNALVNAIKTITFESVNELPTADIKTNVIYLVPKTSSKNKNAKDEYINLDGTTEGWELIGDTAVDLTGYVTESMLNTALADYTTTENLTTLLENKVDKVEGKGLSTNDYTDEDKEKLNSLSNYDDTSLSGRVTTVEDTLDNKVDKVEGKDLSTNDYTDDEKEKLAGLDNRVTTVENSLSDKVDKDGDKVLSTNDYTDAEKAKLEGLSNYDDTVLVGRVTNIEDVIPTSANSENKLATIGDIPEVCEKYTPVGTISQPEATVSGGTTATVNSIVSVGTLPTMSVTNETLVLNPGSLPVKGEDQTVVSTIGTISISQPIFTGMQATITSTAQTSQP